MKLFSVYTFYVNVSSNFMICKSFKYRMAFFRKTKASWRVFNSIIWIITCFRIENFQFWCSIFVCRVFIFLL